MLMVLSKTLPRSLALNLMLFKRWRSGWLECDKDSIFMILLFLLPRIFDLSPNHSWIIMNFQNLFSFSWLLSWFINPTSHNSVQALRFSCLMFHFSFLIPVRRCHGRLSFPSACHVIHARSLALSFCCHPSPTLSDWLLCKFSKFSLVPFDYHDKLACWPD